MRILAAMDFAKEHGTGKYHRTLLSEEMTDDKSGGIIDTLYENAVSRVSLLFNYWIS
jgi:hypothetical protein